MRYQFLRPADPQVRPAYASAMTKSYDAKGCYILATDAGPLKPSAVQNLWGNMVAAYLVYEDTTGQRPLADGALMLGRNSVPRAEFFAVLYGLRFVLDMMTIHEWSPKPIHVVTDHQLLVEIMNRYRRGYALAKHEGAIRAEVARAQRITEAPVVFAHAADQEQRHADGLVRTYRDRILAWRNQIWP